MMQFSTEILQNKPPSLEEGPMRCPAHNKNCVLYRVENRSLFRNCMEIVKLILFLEVIFFVGWLGKILFSNYHLEYNKDITMVHDSFVNNFNGNDFPATPKTMSNDDLVSSIKEIDTISYTERSQISPTLEIATIFPNAEDLYGNNEWPWFNRDPEAVDKDIEWPYKIYHGKNIFSNPSLDDAGINIFEGITKSRTADSDPPKVKIPMTDDLDAPPMLFPTSGLIHVIVDRVYDSNVDSTEKTAVPFPLFEVLGDKKIANEDKVKPEIDTSENNKTSESNDRLELSDESETDLIVQSILDFFEKYANDPEPVITDTTEIHDLNVEGILPPPEDLTVIAKNLNSNDDLVYDSTISAIVSLDRDEMVPSEAEPHVPGSIDKPSQSTKDKNVVEPDAKFSVKRNGVSDDGLNDAEREIMKIFLNSNENFF